MYMSNEAKKEIFITSSTGELKHHIIPEIQAYYRRISYHTVIGESCYTPKKLSNNDDKMRANEIMRELRNKKVHAIIFARGGEYSERVIPFLDKKILKRYPKIIIGFSDVSSILSYFVENSKSKVYHGMMAADAIYSNEKSTNYLKKILAGNLQKIILNDIHVLKEGSVDGVLKGGCMSVLAKLIGHKYSPRFQSNMVFFEDINETVNSLEHFLRRFIKAKKFNKVQAILLGEMHNCGINSKIFWNEFLPIMENIFYKRNIPIAFKIQSGHGKNDIYLPLGQKIRLSLSGKKSEIRIL
ncbi:MAG: hypothetical protein ACD_79C00734G0005 [uncultured bacterium]|nr:MAG: hypothetical protein ACD_79C00734G0005 [uncultured bacterium]